MPRRRSPKPLPQPIAISRAKQHKQRRGAWREGEALNDAGAWIIVVSFFASRLMRWLRQPLQGCALIG